MAEQQSSSGLSITPRKNYTIEAGRSVKDTLNIANLNRQVPLFITLRVVDFTFMDETGTPRMNLAENAPQTTWSLKPFLDIPKQVKVDPGKSVIVNMEIKVPANQGAGSYYSAIQYSSSSAEGGNVNLSASGVTLAFLSVPGTVKEDMKAEKFGAYQRTAPESDKGNFLHVSVDRSPEILAYIFKNNGNVAESPAGSIVLKDMFGNKVADIDKINPNDSIALIGQSRRFEACINAIARKVDLNGSPSEVYTCGKTSLKPGRYTASLSAFYGQNGNETHEITATATFWYLPLWFIAAILGVIVLIAYIIWRIKRRLSKASASKIRTAVSKKPFWKFWKR
jgi:hypothetical protein